VVGSLIAERESAELAEALIAETCAQQQIPAKPLSIHAFSGQGDDIEMCRPAAL
jgi:hypothetical protein